MDNYSMRDVQECIDEIGRAGSSIFSTIDLTSGFWQMMLSPECRKYTAFTIPGVGQFEWNTSPMGLLGAPGSFQRLMEIVIHNLSNISAYIDDLLVHTKDQGKVGWQRCFYLRGSVGFWCLQLFLSAVNLESFIQPG